MNSFNKHIKSSECFAQLIELFPDAVVICIDSGEIVMHNRVFANLLGLGSYDMRGKMLHDLTVREQGVYKCSTGDNVECDAEYINRFKKSFTTFPVKGDNVNLEGYILNKDNTAVPVIFSVSYYLDEEAYAGKYIVTIKDATLLKRAELDQRKARQTAEDANRAKSEFLANMSHEIRTPMNGVLGMLALLKKSDLTSKQQRWAEVAGIAAESLLLIINDILDFSKIESGKFKLDEKPFDLWLTIKDIADLYKVKAAEKNLSFSYRIDDAVPEMLIGDPARLRQIIINLIGNAIKFTDSGSVSIYVKRDEDLGAVIKLKISVTDTGSGIPENLHSLLFKRFSTFEDCSTAKAKGAGLGLVISKQLCELMGGDIGFKSIPKRGSTFWFTCIMKKQKKQLLKESSSQNILKDKKILLVENIEEPECVMFQLQKHGCICEFAPDGNTALSLLNKGVAKGKPFLAVILDRQMHDMESLHFVKIIKGNTLLKDTHIVMAASSGIRGDAAHLQKSGFSGYLTTTLNEKSLISFFTALFEEGSFVTRHTAAEKAKQSRLVLIVEDNDINMEVVSGILESLGYRFETSSNGIKAVEAFKKKTYDIILMDVRMPELDGYGATRRIRSFETEKGMPRVPIIAMSADVTEEAMQACFDAGMDGFIAKPISSQGISEILEKYIFNSAADNKNVFLADNQKDNYGACLFDLKEVLERFNNNEGLLRKIIKGFIENFPVEFERLQSIVQERNNEVLKMHAHSLKGSFGNIGAGSLRSIALELEKAGKEMSFEKAEELLPELQREFERFKVFSLKEIL